jgi:hypothetical protein
MIINEKSCSKKTITIKLVHATTKEIHHVILMRDKPLTLIQYDTGTSVTKMVDVRATIASRVKNVKATTKPIVPMI